ncbi:hypothetical protein ACWEQU_17645 [Streptomyces nodosus]
MSRIYARSSLVGVACSFVIGLTLVACSAESSEKKREYTVPSSLCGTAVSPSALEPLLPAGRDIWSTKGGIASYVRCQLYVDDKMAVDSVILRESSGADLTKIAFTEHNVNRSDVKKKEERYIISGSAAVGHVQCSTRREDGAEVFTVIKKKHGTVDVSTMKNIIAEFTDAASKSEVCTEGDVPSAGFRR